jgi:hypothetical protein
MLSYGKLGGDNPRFFASVFAFALVLLTSGAFFTIRASTKYPNRFVISVSSYIPVSIPWHSLSITSMYRRFDCSTKPKSDNVPSSALYTSCSSSSNCANEEIVRSIRALLIAMTSATPAIIAASKAIVGSIQDVPEKTLAAPSTYPDRNATGTKIKTIKTKSCRDSPLKRGQATISSA